MSDEDVARYIAHSQTGAAGSGSSAGGSTSSGAASAISGANANGGGASAGTAVEVGSGGVSGAGNGGSGHSSTGWQSLDSTGSSSDQSVAPGPSLGIFAQWSSNGTGVGGVVGVESGRQGLWGGMGGMGGMSGAGYPSSSSSLWGPQALEDRHQMGSPASLLPGDLLSGGADSI